MNRTAEHLRLLREAPVRGLILRLAAPTVASMLVTAFYNIVDAWFVGLLDTQSMAAVGVAFPAMAVIQAVGFFFGHGSGNTLARMLGAGDRHGARRMAAVGVVCSAAAGGLLAGLGLLFLRPLALAMGSTPTILPYAEAYLAVTLLGAPAMCAALTLNNQLRFQGKAALAMAGIVSGAVLNCLLDPLFIFVFGWGVAGAAAATAASQAVSLCVLWRMNRRHGVVPVRLRAFAPTRAALGEVVRGGAPSLFRQGLGCLATAALNHAAGPYGDAAIAGMSIVTRIALFVGSALVGFGQGFQPVRGAGGGRGGAALADGHAGAFGLDHPLQHDDAGHPQAGARLAARRLAPGALLHPGRRAPAARFRADGRRGQPGGGRRPCRAAGHPADGADPPRAEAPGRGCATLIPPWNTILGFSTSRSIASGGTA